MSDMIGNTIPVNVRRFERDVLMKLAEEFGGDLDAFMAVQIIKQIDRERRTRKEHTRLLAGNSIKSAIDQPDEPSFSDQEVSGRSIGGHTYPYVAPDQLPEEPNPELPDDIVGLTIGISPVLRTEIRTFWHEGKAPGLLIRSAIDSALLPPDIEE